MSDLLGFGTPPYDKLRTYWTTFCTPSMDGSRKDSRTYKTYLKEGYQEKERAYPWEQYPRGWVWTGTEEESWPESKTPYPGHKE